MAEIMRSDGVEVLGEEAVQVLVALGIEEAYVRRRAMDLAEYGGG